MNPVREFLVIQRINRRLAEKYGKFGSPPRPRLVLKKSRRWQIAEKGKYYIIDVYSDDIYDHHADLEKLARDLGALAEWETIAEETTSKKGS